MRHFPLRLLHRRPARSHAVQNAKGVRNIWLAEPPAYKGRQLTAYTQDDGEEMGELAWTSDEHAIIYTRGGDQEGFGENPNPQSLPAEPKQMICIAYIEGKRPQELAEGHSAVVAPHTNRLAYIKARDIWITKTDASEKPSMLAQSKGRSGSLHWSPDEKIRLYHQSRRPWFHRRL